MHNDWSDETSTGSRRVSQRYLVFVDLNSANSPHVTVGQIVAYNVRRLRNDGGLTQEELGRELTTLTGNPWSPTTMSMVESGWDGRPSRVRNFGADHLAALAMAFKSSISSLFLPPEKTPTGEAVDASWRWITLGKSNDAAALTSDHLLVLCDPKPRSKKAPERLEDMSKDDVQRMRRELLRDLRRVTNALSRIEANE